MDNPAASSAQEHTLSGVVSAISGTSITLMTPEGVSKEIYFTPKTSISKSVEAGMADITVDSTVCISGAANSDGNFLASDVQVRPVSRVAPQ